MGLLWIGCGASADDHYARPQAPSPASPYTNWTAAAPNIQQALDVAGSNDVVWVSNGVYMLVQSLTVSNAIRLAGVNGPDHVTIDGGDATRCLYLDCSNAVIEGVTLTRGAGQGDGGCVFMNRGGTLRRCRVVHNRATNGFGAVCCYWGGLLENCVVASNQASHCGGGVYACHAGSIVRDCLIFANQAGLDGGGVMCDGGGARVEQSVIRDNRADRNGGGACLVNGGSIRNSVICGNYAGAARGGGGVHMDGCSIVNCTISGNSTLDSRATGVYFIDPATLINCIVFYNYGLSEYVYEYSFWSSHTTLNNCCMPSFPSGDHIRTNANIGADPR